MEAMIPVVFSWMVAAHKLCGLGGVVPSPSLTRRVYH